MLCSGIFDDSPYMKALQKAQNPRMTTRDNPLATHSVEELKQRQLVDRNMDLLRADAHAREGIHGRTYEAIMGTRFNG